MWYGKPGGMSHHPERFSQQLESLKRGDKLPFIEVTAEDIEDFRRVYNRFEHHDPALIDVKRYTRQLMDLEALPRYSSLPFLGYFAILESLLTHQPKQTDPYEFITRQVKTKVAA